METADGQKEEVCQEGPDIKPGADNLERICDYCNSIGVKALTVYAFSTENWNRPKDEVDADGIAFIIIF